MCMHAAVVKGHKVMFYISVWLIGRHKGTRVYYPPSPGQRSTWPVEPTRTRKRKRLLSYKNCPFLSSFAVRVLYGCHCVDRAMQKDSNRVQPHSTATAVYDTEMYPKRCNQFIPASWQLSFRLLPQQHVCMGV